MPIFIDFQNQYEYGTCIQEVAFRKRTLNMHQNVPQVK